MSDDGYKIRDQKAIHFITFAVVEWVDVFTRQEYRDIVVQSIAFCQQKKGLKLHGWVIMSNHLHLLISAGGDFTLSEILRDFKKTYLDRNNKCNRKERSGKQETMDARYFQRSGKREYPKHHLSILATG